MPTVRLFLAAALALNLPLTLSAGAEVAPAAGEHAVTPESHEVDGSFIQPYQAKWRLISKSKDGSVSQMGTWSDAVKISKLDGRDVIVRRQMWLHDKGAEGYVNIVDHKTLEPIVTVWVNSLGLYRRMEFSPDGRSVKFQTARLPAGEGVPDTGRPFSFADPMSSGTIRLKHRLFDFNTGMFGLLIAGFPLREGYSARLPVFRSYAPKAAPAWIDFHVTGTIMVDAGAGKKVDAWVVLLHSPDTGETITFDLTKQSPYVVGLQQGWKDREWTFEMM